jgi:hypothetical protein
MADTRKKICITTIDGDKIEWVSTNEEEIQNIIDGFGQRRDVQGKMPAGDQWFVPYHALASIVVTRF